MTSLTIILGAGFSFEAGLPLGKDIQDRFDRDLTAKLLKFSSGEWMWVDNKRKDELVNGSNNYDYMSCSYILNECLLNYKSSKGAFVDYEDFYQFIIDKSLNLEEYKSIFKKAEIKFLKDNPLLKKTSDHLHIFNNLNYRLIQDIVNYLIWDMLAINKPIEEIQIAYKPFIDFVNSFDEVNIFTLNHDTLVEMLLEENNIEYTKGFSKVNSNIQYEGNPLDTYQGIFNNCKVKLFKMHGSVDCYQFEHCNQNGAFLERTREGTYYLPKGYRARHYSKRIDVKSGNIVQDFSPDVVPKFITGKDKTRIINNDVMYSDLYERFFKILNETENLLISGYSYRDEHINKALLNCRAKNVINQNPFDLFPFKQEHKNIKSFNNLLQ